MGRWEVLGIGHSFIGSSVWGVIGAREGVSVGQALLNATHFVRLSVPLGGDRYRYSQDEWWISGTRNNNEMCSARPGDAGAGSHRARGSELLLHHTQTVIEGS